MPFPPVPPQSKYCFISPLLKLTKLLCSPLSLPTEFTVHSLHVLIPHTLEPEQSQAKSPYLVICLVLINHCFNSMLQNDASASIFFIFLLQETKSSLKIIVIARNYQNKYFYYILSPCLLCAFVSSMCPVSVTAGSVFAGQTWKLILRPN